MAQKPHIEKVRDTLFALAKITQGPIHCLPRPDVTFQYPAEPQENARGLVPKRLSLISPSGVEKEAIQRWVGDPNAIAIWPVQEVDHTPTLSTLSKLLKQLHIAHAVVSVQNADGKAKSRTEGIMLDMQAVDTAQLDRLQSALKSARAEALEQFRTNPQAWPDPLERLIMLGLPEKQYQKELAALKAHIPAETWAERYNSTPHRTITPQQKGR